MIFAAAASVGWWLFFRFLYLLISIFTTQTPPSPSPTLSLVSRGIKWENERWRWPREIGRTGGKYNHHVFLEICDLITFTSLLKSLSLITRFFRFQKGKNNVLLELISSVFCYFFFPFYYCRFIPTLSTSLLAPSNVPPGTQFLNKKQQGNDTFLFFILIIIIIIYWDENLHNTTFK